MATNWRADDWRLQGASKHDGILAYVVDGDIHCRSCVDTPGTVVSCEPGKVPVYPNYVAPWIRTCGTCESGIWL